MIATTPQTEISSEPEVVSSILLSSQQLNLWKSIESFSAPYLEEKLLLEENFETREEYEIAFNEFKKVRLPYPNYEI